ncbi:hypothetical protein IGI04_038052 [Brassica rapa subsp. trilocularis]|uniref:Uncharacterized protein n=1 Tax=Brassica rapa subsp. trilocularis TaxID=1813537 RepID=A0ABQ7LJ43_BRACM|nr:hypothetical protein IGI04_038052 [Brassica rapa subsp. trilocularis]
MDRLRSRRRRRRVMCFPGLMVKMVKTVTGQTLTKTVRGMMYYRKALELQAFLDMAKDEGASRNFVMITSKTCVQIPESALLKERPLVESGKNSQRYIKYTADYLERLLDELFEGKSMNEPRSFELKPDLCQKVSSFELDDSLVHCVADGAVQREEVRRECGKGVTSSKALCGHMACHFEREKRVSCSHFFQVKKSVKSSVISHGLV